MCMPILFFCRRAVIATFDLSAQNLDLLHTDHWLCNKENVLHLRLTQPAYITQGAALDSVAAPSDQSNDAFACSVCLAFSLLLSLAQLPSSLCGGTAGFVRKKGHNVGAQV